MIAPALHTAGGCVRGDALTTERLRAVAADLRAAARDLAARGVDRRAELIARVARGWQGERGPPDDATRARLFDHGARIAGIAPQMLRWGMDETLGRWTARALRTLVRDELGDAPVAGPGAVDDDMARIAVAPELCVQVLARTVPPAGLQAVALSWLLGSAVLVRPSIHLAPIVVAFADALAALAPELARATAVLVCDADDATWRDALAGLADALVVHGGDDAVAAWREAAAPRVRFVGHGHKISAGFLPAEGMDEPALTAHLDGFALDLCAWDQLGCLSPETLYVERGGPVSVADVALRLLARVPGLERRLPPGPWSDEVRAERTLFARARSFEAELLASGSAQVLVYDHPAPPGESCLHRTLAVRPVASETELVEVLAVIAPHLQGLAVAGSREVRARLARSLAPAGVSRVCPPGELQRPPLGWSDDGAGVLLPLVRRVDV